jgi:hypothetical protein
MIGRLPSSIRNANGDRPLRAKFATNKQCPGWDSNPHVLADSRV